MTFTEHASRLGGHCAWILGWRPADFWNATPLELSGILDVATSTCTAPPVSSELQKLMELFPDG